MRSVLSYYKINGESKPIFLIIDDNLASMMNNTQFSLTYNVSSINDAKNKVAEVLGGEDMFNSAYPISAVAGTDIGDFARDVKEFLPNSYYVEPTPYLNNYNCEVGNISLYGFASTSSPTAEVNTTYKGSANTYNFYEGKTPYFLALKNSIYNSTSGRYYHMRIYFFVFTEAEYNNGNFDFSNSTTNKYTVCTIEYNRPSAEATSQHRVIINRSANQPSDIIARALFNNFAPPTPPGPTPSGDDPYGPTPGGPGYSGSGGGPAGTGGTGATGTGGLHDDTSDAIPTPNTPSDVAISGGLFTAYNPSASQLANFASKLWNADPTSLGDLFRLLFGGDAFNAIIGLHLLPIAPTVGGSQNIMLGNWDSEASAPRITSQYKQVNFGSLLLPEYWGNSIDYSPYTRIQLALPYIGIVDVDTDDVLGSTNTLTYNIDVLSGAICATLHCVKGNLNSVIYQWGGSCAVQLPITGSSFNSVMSAIAGVGAAVGGAVAFASGPMGAALGTAGSLAVGSGLVSGSAANMFGSMKGKIQKSGGISANSGALGIMTPYFIITRPVQSVPETWQADKGYPSNISAQLGTVTGYTEVSEINLECSGTEAEKNEIIDLLKKGVLF